MNAKKSIFKRITLLLCLITAFCFILTGCQNMPGKSAYQIALDNGFTGTEVEWLQSMQGKDGLDADISIEDIFEAYLERYPDATFEEFLQSYLSVEYHPTEDAVNTALRSVVSIYSLFSYRGSDDGYGAGSGVIVRINKTSGLAYIITNYHVVYDSSSTTGKAKEISVFLYGKEYEDYEISATYVGGVLDSDIAVIKATSNAFKDDSVVAAKIADSDKIAVGETAVAVGFPRAYGISATSGIVSVDSEEIPMEGLDNSSRTVYHRVIRVDAAINSGNSGGGLFNKYGELIGIVNAKNIETNVENIGYAIPSNVAKGIADNIIDGGAKKYLLGITTTVDNSKAVYDSASKKVRIVEEVSVSAVTTNSISNGNLKAGDKLLSMKINDGEELKITRYFQVSDNMLKVRSGDKITFKILRGLVENTITLMVSESYTQKLA